MTPSSGNIMSTVMVLRKMRFRKSPSQHLKQTLPSPTHQYFKTQKILSRYPISTNSFLFPSIFSPQTVSMAFLNIKYINSLSQLLKKTLPSLKHQDFETQQMWSRLPVTTNSCAAPVRLSHQKVSIMSGKSIASCVNHIFPIVILVIFKILTRGKKKWAVKYG